MLNCGNFSKWISISFISDLNPFSRLNRNEITMRWRYINTTYKIIRSPLAIRWYSFRFKATIKSSNLFEFCENHCDAWVPVAGVRQKKRQKDKSQGWIHHWRLNFMFNYKLNSMTESHQKSLKINETTEKSWNIVSVILMVF